MVSSEMPAKAANREDRDDGYLESLRSTLLEIFLSESIAGCHIETAAEGLARLPRRSVPPVLAQVRLIAESVSDLLAFAFMENVGHALNALSVKQLEDWVKGALAVYEEEGLHAAREYLCRSAETALPYAGMGYVATLEGTAKQFRLLVAGLAGRELTMKPSDIVCTDTSSIYAPRTFSRYRSCQENTLFYRIVFAHKCAQIRYHSFHMALSSLQESFPRLFSLHGGKDELNATGIEFFCRAIAEGESGAELYALVDTARIEAALRRDFSGLGRALFHMKKILRRTAGDLPRQAAVPPVVRLIQWILDDYPGAAAGFDGLFEETLFRLRQPESTALDSAAACCLFVRSDPELRGLDKARVVLPYIGTVRPKAVARELGKRRQEVEKRFVEVLGAIILERERKGKMDDVAPEDDGTFVRNPLSEGEQGLALIVPQEAERNVRPDQPDVLGLVMLEGLSEELGEEYRRLLAEIEADLGRVPSSYVSGAMRLASGAWTDLEVGPDNHGGAVATGYEYDEWDFRRRAYRRAWCSLREVEAPEVLGDFFAQTLQRHRGQVLLLRRSFEMLRPQYRFMRHQRDGDDIDVDAVVKAYADARASVTPSEYLFIRQQRRERDIAVSFLVDMSASTEGWVNTGIRESLVLLCEALHVLGDRYAIYGFSGMRRTGCQFFRIKDFEDPYDDRVKARISGINARDYTRMGPPIRHVTKLFRQSDARLKILISLSDGKPEDYDEYKGPYAVEDTKMALIEARREGIRPFCITIDKEARDYLPHMYGEVNYVLVQDVALLYRRVPEIYRLLTT
jgi:nitric oxide reductase NorD protein